VAVQSPIDPVALTGDLIRRPSVTPADAGAMDVLQRALEGLGFACRRMRFGGIENLYARRGTAGPNLCFAGHTDVVPAGDRAAWRYDPFKGEVEDGVLHGRGAVDMKGAIAAWTAAVSAVLARAEPSGSLSFLITGDEEGEATDGTVRVVQALREEGEVIDHCLVGEPSSSAVLGDMIKVGRRGSINAYIEVSGTQGHVAYPHRAANPVPVLVGLLHRLQNRVLDDGYHSFQPSNLEITTVDVGNPTTNLIPAATKARVNIRFNPNHTGAALAAWFEEEARIANEGFSGQVKVTTAISGEAFLTEPGPFVDVVAGAVRTITAQEPDLSTTGGTSDARFIRAMCPVVEFGLVGATMHGIDERVPVEELTRLTAIYRQVIEGYFARFAPSVTA
jgi:succinyl-diaminopimelate desuccinylase